MAEIEHKLHEKVGELLEQFVKENSFIARLDSACGGDQYIPLFYAPKANATCLCNVDAMLLKEVNGNKEVVAIIEIEESDITPTNICGKYLTTALSSQYNHEKDGNIVLKPNSIKFIQIVDASSETNDKKSQLINIGDLIRNKLCGCVRSYDIILANNNDLKNKLGTILNEISK